MLVLMLLKQNWQTWSRVLDEALSNFDLLLETHLISTGTRPEVLV